MEQDAAFRLVCPIYICESNLSDFGILVIDLAGFGHLLGLLS